MAGLSKRSQQGRSAVHVPWVAGNLEVGLETELAGEGGQLFTNIRAVAGEEGASQESLLRMINFLPVVRGTR